MIILGLAINIDESPGNGEYIFRDNGAALIADGSLVSVMDRQKLTKMKHHNTSDSLPAIRFVLKDYGIRLKNVDKIALFAKGNHLKDHIPAKLQKEFDVDINGRELSFVDPHFSYAMNLLTMLADERCLFLTVHETDEQVSLMVLKGENSSLDELAFFPGVDREKLPIEKIWERLSCLQKESHYPRLAISGNSQLPLAFEEKIRSAGMFRDIFNHPLEHASGWALGAGLYLYHQETSCQQQPRVTYQLPRNETEKILSQIWQKILSTEKIGINDDFFHRGGNSLTAIILENEIHKTFHKKIPLADIFKYPTIKELSPCLQELPEDQYTAIEPVEKKEYYALSSGQQWLYIDHQMELASTAYNMTQAIVFPGVPDMDRLKQAFNKLLAQHESLRTSFHIEGYEPVQRINPHGELTVDYYDTASGEQEVEAFIRDFIRSFDLSRAPLMRVGVIKTGETRYILLVDMHHIITDGTSLDILGKELFALYSGQECPPLKIQYKDFSQWQNSREITGTIQQQEGYWLNQFQGEIPVLNLPTDFAPLKIQSFAGSMSHFEIPAQQTRAVRATAMQNRTTLFTVLLTLQTIFFSKISGQEDIVMGTPLAGRRHADLEKVIGMFLNFLALRNFPAARKRFSEFLTEVKEHTIEAFENQDYPFERMVEKLGIESIASGNPLYRVVLILLNFSQRSGPGPAHSLNTKTANEPGLEKYRLERRIATNDMTLYVEEAGDILVCSWEYCTKLFKPGTMQRFTRYFQKIISAVLENPQVKISEISMIPDDERHRLLFEFNNTKKEIIKNKCYHQVWEEQVQRYSHRVAAVYHCTQITYHHLNAYANGIAHFLVQHGVKPGAVLPVFMTRSIHMLASIIGVFKAGAVYLPIDTEYPVDRIKHILEECDVQALITQSGNMWWVEMIAKGLPLLETILGLDDGESISKDLTQYPAANPHIPGQPNDLAYMIYTSGTTGKPKGVMIHHLGMLNHLYAKINHLDIIGEDVIAQTASACFDISVWQFLAGLLTGACTFIIDKEVVVDALNFLPVLQQRQITILESVPSLVTSFLEMTRNESQKKLNHLRWVIITGEALGVHLVKAWYQQYPGIPLLNAYGPTEASDDVTHYVVKESPGENQYTIPIGKPVQNMHIYILDKNLSLCGIGIRGEICTAGLGVGKGYWKDPQKTSKAFIPNPLAAEIRDKDYALLYRTGDIGYFREDGSVECLGRLDHQVKIRGNRVELGEIENQLLNYQGIEKAVVIALNTVGADMRDQDREYQYLCAYYVSKQEIHPRLLQEYLSRGLPDYMIPSFFVFLETLPLTLNGKVDRKALPTPELEPEEQYTGPENQREEKLTEIWSEILGLPKGNISIDANFFRLGGNSLTANVLAAKIHQAFDVKLPLAEVFKNSTIKTLAAFIKECSQDKYAAIKSLEEKEYYRLSSAQKRLYILQQIDLNSTAYNIPDVIPLTGESNPGQLQEIFIQLIKHHESFRTSILTVDNEPVQRIHKQVELPLQYIEFADSQEVDTVIKNFVKPFDLTAAPLARVGFLEVEPGKYLLLVDIHHIISDGISKYILEQDLMTLYTGQELPGLRIQYKDFSQWQTSDQHQEMLKKQENYWLNQFQGDIPLLDLPTDYSRPEVFRFEGDQLTFEIGAPETRLLKQAALEEGTTLFMLLLAVFYLVLSRLSRQEDIIIGTGTAGRNHADLHRIIGMLVNIIPLRNYPREQESFRKFLGEVKQRTLEAFENQDFQFNDLAALLNLNMRGNFNPLTRVMFSFQNLDMEPGKFPAIIPGKEIFTVLKNYLGIETEISRFDLTLRGWEVEDKLFMHFEYSTQLFKKERINRFIKYYQVTLTTVLENRDILLKEINLSPDLHLKKIDNPVVDFGF